MDNANARLTNCIVTQNVAEGPGGGVYLGGGRIESSLLFNNSSDADGGAVYMDNSGLVLRSMLTNNAAANGAAIYLARNGNYVDGYPHPAFWRIAAEEGCTAIIGVDAHSPAHLENPRYWEEGLRLLRGLGIERTRTIRLRAWEDAAKG